ncbi:MAG: sulfatase [Akkermansiaceae bacterium]|nr:sulfatase [Akkermansiaceae bacterium]
MNKWTGFLLGVCLVSSVLAEGRQPPNLVIILTDDQGYADLGCFGGKHVNTPRIDQMAKEGARLTSFYMAGAVCTPSRAALMTGSYPKRVGMAENVLLAGDPKGLNPSELTIAEVLKSAGYKTGMFGKWHLGDQPEFLPRQQGFDVFFGIPYSHDIHPFHGNDKKYHFPPLPLLEDATVVELEPDADYLTKRITERAVRFIQENKDAPFFLYLPHPVPHRPISVSPPFRKNVPDSLKAKLAQEKQNKTIDYPTRDKMYASAIGEIDWSVGQVLEALKKYGIDDNTLVIFTSDNGPMVGKATPLKGKKGSTFEGGMRVPTVVRWPGNIPAGVDRDELMTAMDLLPTFAKLAGAGIPDDRVIDGKDIWPVLSGNGDAPHEAFFYHKKNALAAVRSGNWKLHVKGRKPVALYNLATDIGEKKNLLRDNPEVVARLQGYISDFEKELAQNSRPAASVENPKALSTRKTQ